MGPIIVNIPAFQDELYIEKTHSPYQKERCCIFLSTLCHNN